MPNVTISWNRSAGDSNYIYGMPGGTIGPDSGSRTVNVGYGQTYNLTSSGSGPGYTATRRLNNQSLGLDDRQGFSNVITYSTVPLYRYYNPTNGDHFSGLSNSPPSGYVNEGALTNVFVGNQPPGTVALSDNEGGSKPTSTYTAYVWPWNASSFNIGTFSISPRLIYSLTNGYDTMWSTASNEAYPTYQFDPQAGNGSNGYAFYGANNATNLTINVSAGGDGDFNDMIVYVSDGTFTGDTTYVGPSAIYGCTDSAATNYNSTANVNSGCVYANPNPTLTVNGQTSSQTIVEGENITIDWTANDAAYITSASITGLGSLSSNQFGQGSFTVSPSQDTVYTFTTNYPPNNTRSFSLTVNVKEIPEITASFVAGNTITRGNSATLQWTVTGSAENLTISPNLGSQNLSGQVTVSPTTTTTYVIYASTPGYGGVLQDTVSLELTVIQPPSASMVVPSTIDWGDSSYEVQFDFTNVVSYDVTVEYTDLDGVMITHPAITGADPSITTTSLLIADETASITPRWNARGYSLGKVKLKAYGSGSLFVEAEQTFNIDIDQMPDQITIPASEDKFLNEEPVITPDVTVTSEKIVVDDVDIPVEVKANSPIQIEIDDGGVWYSIRQT